LCRVLFVIRIRFLLILLGSAATLTAGMGATQPPTRVLFVGNSLTAVNDVPQMVQQIAAANGHRYECQAIVFGNHGLEEHWNRPEARRAIANGGWAFVILQQGPSALPESRRILLHYANQFDKEIRAVGARSAFYMVWPSRDRFGDFAGVSASYRAAAQAVNGILLPAGDAWRAAWRRDAKLALYGGDGFHPSPMGSYLAALVIYQGLAGRPPALLPPLVKMPDNAPSLFQEAATAVLAGR
jgi:hypothetical protein